MTRKTQKKLRKILTLVSCAVLLVCVTVVGTIAYLQATTNTVTNTFTVGNVSFGDDPKTDLDEGLTEAKVNEEGQPIDENGTVVEREKAPRVNENEYKLMPGHTYTKDPTVKIGADSEAAYVRMIVTINEITALKAACGVDVFMPQDFVDGWDENIWPCVSFESVDDSVVCEFWYHETVSTEGAGAKNLEPLFTSIIVPENATNDELKALEDLKIDVVAHAIQADGFDSAEDAWDAFN